ncbi:MAG: FGGY-family carbohydrate kinase [Leptolyngbyaceae cyanobacterium bins.59]|nr:FGGY-family carbohydrate kinase [Leptolyngbyaceae cyanobacterium bins.59]
MAFYLGLDFGTSGMRAIVLDQDKQIQFQASGRYPQHNLDWAKTWTQGLRELLSQIPEVLRRSLQGIAIDGTSASVLFCNAQGKPVAPPLLYNDARGASFLEQVRSIAPPNHVTLSATSSLTKLLWASHQPWFSEVRFLLHQADWLGFLLHGHFGISDYHNCLKLGYDVEQLQYPNWLTRSSWASYLPETVLTPGQPIAPVLPDWVDRYHLPANCQVCAGTTDSIAAFLASGASRPGEAVTSLGSTLVVKLLSRHRIDDARYGLYSHRLGNDWLVGGASNTGGAVLNRYFSPQELQRLSEQIKDDQESPLDYYPLLEPGERFPINDPQLLPRLEPRPTDSVQFLHGLLESMARIEARGYHLLQELGADPLLQVYTAGGGAGNEAWKGIRARHLGVPVLPSAHTEAAYGTALLARQGGQS